MIVKRQLNGADTYRLEQRDSWTPDLDQAHEFPDWRAGAIRQMLTDQRQPGDFYATTKEEEKVRLAKPEKVE